MTEQSLTAQERQCLRFLAGLAPEAARWCDERTLHDLEHRRLVERVVTCSLPLEMRRQEYRLTLAGRSVLGLGGTT